jgi:hypothetical protein
MAPESATQAPASEVARYERRPGHQLRSPPADISAGIRSDLTTNEPNFERDIRLLFREQDIDMMSFAFDLSSYDDVRESAEEIYGRLADGTMPCDKAWPAAHLQRFRAWIDAGAPP